MEEEKDKIVQDIPSHAEDDIKAIINKDKDSIPRINLYGIDVNLKDYQSIVDSCKEERDIDVILNGRLGSYNRYGQYIIDSSIKQELIDMPKLIYSVYFDEDRGITTYEARGMLPVFGDILFMLTIGEDEAVFYLVEEIRRKEAGYTEVAREVLDTMPIDPDDPIPEEYILDMYNLYSEEMGESVLELKYNCENILVRKIYFSLLSGMLFGKEGIADDDIVGQAMELFMRSGEVGARVLQELSFMLKGNPQLEGFSTKTTYNKIMLDMMFTCLDGLAHKEGVDKDRAKELYNELRFMRARSMKSLIDRAHLRLDEGHVIKLAKKVNQDFVKKDDAGLENDKQYVIALTSSIKEREKERRQSRSHRPTGAILKQIKKEIEKEEKIDNPNETKEEKILRILAKSEGKKEASKSPSDKKPATKKVKPAKKPVKKTSAKKPSVKKSKPSKPKIKSKGGKVKGGAKPKVQVKSKPKSKGADKGKGKSKKDDKKKNKKKDKKKDDDIKKKTMMPIMFGFARPAIITPHVPVKPVFTPPPIIKKAYTKVEIQKKEDIESEFFSVSSSETQVQYSAELSMESYNLKKNSGSEENQMIIMRKEEPYISISDTKEESQLNYREEMTQEFSEVNRQRDLGL